MFNVLLGLIVAAAPFFTTESTTAFWNTIIVGLAVAALAGYNAWAARNATRTAAWMAGVNVVLGLWLIVAAFLFAMSTALYWTTIVMGALIGLVAAFNSWAAGTTGGRTNRRASI